MFFLCSCCDRGQVYCSAACRETARRLQLRAANVRHQRSEEGRLDHRDRQRDYRRRLAGGGCASAAKTVTDHGSNPPLAFAKIEPLLLSAPPAPLRLPEMSDLGWIVCYFCGRIGRFINPFYDLE
jgi:hypothetical protein